MAQHIIRTQQFDRRYLEELFVATDQVRSGMKTLRRDGVLSDHLMISLFYEPSTRTRLSFEAAAHHLGVSVRGTENAEQFSSAAKGETLEDTIKVLCSYAPSVIILRHKEEGAAERAAQIAEDFGVSLVNAGDGTGQHPTQSLLDMYSLKRECGTIDNLSIVIGGDLKYGRTVRSLAYLLTRYDGVKISFVSHAELAIGDDVRNHLEECGVSFTETDNLRDVLPNADAVYWTRTQRERMSAQSQALYTVYDERNFTIGEREMALLPPHAKLFHPLPRVKEIEKAVDNDPRAAYFRQAENGLYIRMALLKQLLSHR